MAASGAKKKTVIPHKRYSVRSTKDPDEKFYLGFDMGTSSIKACIVSASSRNVVESLVKSRDTAPAHFNDNEGKGYSEQNVSLLFSFLNTMLRLLVPKVGGENILGIGVCGQMHGICFWNTDKKSKPDINTHVFDNVSHLYTWEDKRCDQEFIKSLPTPSSHIPLASGFGYVTLAWLAKNNPQLLEKYNRAGTVQDYIVSSLCNLNKPVMTPQNAASWGYFNCKHNNWNQDLLSSMNIPDYFIPDLVDDGDIAGTLSDNWNGIPLGTIVFAALGDFQCSVYPIMTKPRQAVINVSTSAQICMRLPQGFEISNEPPPRPVEPEEDGTLDPKLVLDIVPFFDSHLLVAASLNGGNVMAAFVKLLQSWILDLNITAKSGGQDMKALWKRVIELATLEESDSDMVISCCLYGERYNPTLRRGLMTNISDKKIQNVGKYFRALCKGVIVNLSYMMPPSLLHKNDIECIAGGGAGLTRNECLVDAITKIYKIPAYLDSRSDSAYGAALIAYEKHNQQ